MLLLITSIHTFAYDFESDGLYYNILSKEDGTAEVTYEYTDSYGQHRNDAEGDIEIPSTVICIIKPGYSQIYHVKSIGDHAFSYCKEVTSVSIPNSVTSIGKEAFYGYNKLASVTIPNSVTYIGELAFYGRLMEINVEYDNPSYASIDGILYNKDVTTLIQCPWVKASIEIPNSVTSIGEWALGDCHNLTSAIIPNSVKSIGERAFSGCIKLTSVNIPNSVTHIGNRAFYYCERLTSMTLPNSVTSIGERTFYNCTEMKSVTIPNSVTSIGNGAFFNCSGLKSVAIPNSVTSICDSVFSYCANLTSMTIPNSVTSIGKEAFYCCGRMTSVTIPNSVTFIGEWAFYNCNGLTTIYCHAVTPPSANNVLFSNASFEKCKLYVPAGCLAAYAAAYPWKYFLNIAEMDFSGIDETAVADGKPQILVGDGTLTIIDKSNEPATIYDMQGRIVYHGTDRTLSNVSPGLYIMKIGNNTMKFAI